MTSFDPGGTERQMIELVRRLDPSRWAVHVAVLSRPRRVVQPRRRGGRVGRRVSGRRVSQSSRTRSPSWAFARWCRAQRHRRRAHDASSTRTSSACPAPRWRGVPVRIGNRREINPDKIAGADRDAARRLRAARTRSSRTRTPRRTGCALEACPCAQDRGDPQRARPRPLQPRRPRTRRRARSSSSRTCGRRRATTC